VFIEAWAKTRQRSEATEFSSMPDPQKILPRSREFRGDFDFDGRSHAAIPFRLKLSF
jgi:hypothetical protein